MIHTLPVIIEPVPMLAIASASCLHLPCTMHCLGLADGQAAETVSRLHGVKWPEYSGAEPVRTHTL